MTINSDKISEKYRKYVIRIDSLSKERLYFLWGTDLSNEDFDYLLLNESNNIIAFRTISLLVQYLTVNDVLIDPDTTKEWAKYYKNNKGYSSYNLLYLKNRLIVNDFVLRNLERDDAVAFLSFYNLFSDYARQINDESMLKIINKQNFKLFFDYVNNSFLWDTKGNEASIEKGVARFNNVTFVSHYLKIIEIFQGKMEIKH